MNARLVATGLILLLLGVGAGWLLFQSWRASRGLAAWPTVPGQMLSMEAAEEVDVVPGSSNSNRRATPQIRLVGRYRYEVAGQTYEGDRIGTRPFIQRDEGAGLTRADMLGVLRSHPAGSTVSVHHHPTEHERSYVVYRPARDSLLLTALCTGMVLSGLVTLLAGLRASS